MSVAELVAALDDWSDVRLANYLGTLLEIPSGLKLDARRA